MSGSYGAPCREHDWYVEPVSQGLVPRILCRRCPAEKPRTRPTAKDREDA